MTKAVVMVSKSSVGDFLLAIVPYDQRVVNAIKSKVRKEDRSYDPRTKLWIINTSDAMRELVWGTRHWIDFQK